MIAFFLGVLIGLAAGVGTAVAVIQNYERMIEDMRRDLSCAGWRGHA